MPLTLPLQTITQSAQAINTLTRSPVFPVTEMAFLSVANNTLHIKRTDTANWLSLSIDGEGDTTDTTIQVDAGKLADLVGKLSGEAVKLDIDGGYLHLSAGRSKRKLAGLAVSYPEPPAATTFPLPIDMDALNEAIAFVSPIVGTEHQLQYIHGVRLQDGHAIGTNAAGFCAAGFDWAGEPVTLTLSSLKLLKHVKQPATASFDGGMIRFGWDGGELLCKALDGPWSFLANGVAGFLKEHETFLTVQPGELIRAVAAVDAVAANDVTSKSNRVTLHLSRDGCEVVPVSNIGSGVEPIDAEWDSEPITVNFLMSNLRKVLAGFMQDRDVRIGITPIPDDVSQAKGCVIRQEAMPHVVSMLSQVR